MTDQHAEQSQVEDARPLKSAVVTQTKVTLFVHRSNQQWVVRDRDGNFWILPNVENPWNQRQPFCPTQENELEPIPGHYKYLLRLPS
jgi:hypothetical protein